MKASLRRVLVITLVACLFIPIAAFAAPRTLKGTVSGVVLYPNGKPAAGVTVEVWEPRVIGLPPVDWRLAARFTTAKNGTYSASIPPGTYRVWFVPKDLETYCMEAYPNAPTPYHGDDVVVRAGRLTSRVSVQLDTGPSFIIGTARDVSADPAEPLPGMRMYLCMQGYALINAVHTVYTDSNGNYRIGGLKPFDWGVAANGTSETEPQTHPDLDTLFGGLYDWSIDVPGKTETLDFDFQSDGFVNLCGTLVHEETGDPVIGAIVRCYVQEPDGNFYGDAVSITNEYGYFEFTDVPAPGPPNNVGYAVLLADPQSTGLFWSEFFDNADSEWSAQWIPVQRGVTYDVGNWFVNGGYGP